MIRFRLFAAIGFILVPLSLKAAYIMNESGVQPTSGAAYKSKGTTSASRRSNEKKPSTTFNETEFLSSLSSRYNIDETRLAYLRQIHYGYDILIPAVVISSKAEKDIGQVLKMKMDGTSWETISTDFYVPWEPTKKEISDILGPARKNIPKLWMTERPSTRSDQ